MLQIDHLFVLTPLCSDIVICNIFWDMQQHMLITNRSRRAMYITLSYQTCLVAGNVDY